PGIAWVKFRRVIVASSPRKKAMLGSRLCPPAPTSCHCSPLANCPEGNPPQTIPNLKVPKKANKNGGSGGARTRNRQKPQTLQTISTYRRYCGCFTRETAQLHRSEICYCRWSMVIASQIVPKAGTVL